MTGAARRHALAVMTMLYTHRTLLRYPLNDLRAAWDAQSWQLTEQQAATLLGQGGHMQSDCSQTCAWILKCVGCWPWPWPGYTGSHLQTIHPWYTDARAAEVGALVVFGPGTGHHEAIVHTPDPRHGDPLLGSHGRPGYDLVKLSVLAASQAAEGFPGVRLLSVADL